MSHHMVRGDGEKVFVPKFGWERVRSCNKSIPQPQVVYGSLIFQSHAIAVCEKEFGLSPREAPRLKISEQPDWEYLRDGAITLFRSKDVLEKAVETLAHCNYAVHRIDCETQSQFLASLATALRWHDNFGYLPTRLNLDALNDALREEPYNSCDAAVLVFDAFDSLAEIGHSRAFAVLDLVERHARDYLLSGKKLLGFVHTKNARLHIDGLGGRAASWNSAEWSIKDRD